MIKRDQPVAFFWSIHCDISECVWNDSKTTEEDVCPIPFWAREGWFVGDNLVLCPVHVDEIGRAKLMSERLAKIYKPLQVMKESWCNKW